MTSRSRRSQAALRVSEASCVPLMEDLAETVSRFGADGRLTFLNAAFCRWFGRAREELIGTPWQSYVLAEEVPQIEASLSRLAPGNPVVVTRNRVHSAEGDLRWPEFTYRAFFGSDGERVAIQVVGREVPGDARAPVATARDIAVHEGREQPGSESEERFRTLVERAPEGIFVQTRWRFAYVNPALVRLFGATGPEQLLGELVESRLHPDLLPVAQERIRRLNEERRPKPLLDQVFVRFDGSRCDVSVSGVPFEFKGERGALVFGRDITERKRLEEELRRLNFGLEQRVAERTAALTAENTQRQEREVQLQKLWRAAEHSPASVVITDATAAIEYVNPQFERETGYPAAEVTGKNPRFLQSGTHSPEFYAGRWETLASGQTWRGELCNRRKDGTLFWELAPLSAPPCQPAGRPAGSPPQHASGLFDPTRSSQTAPPEKRHSGSADAEPGEGGVGAPTRFVIRLEAFSSACFFLSPAAVSK